MNIYALATSPGKAGVAIIRVSGRDLSDIFHKFNIEKTIKPRYANFVDIYNPIDGEILDNAVVIYFKSPNSFTGEDVVEWHLHGSKAVISKMFEALGSFDNMRLAEPGEFAKRAFLNNKIDLYQAEGLEDLINSQTDLQAKQAIRQMSGQLSRYYDSWRENLITALAQIEAYIDFPDEDIPDNIICEVEDIVNKVCKEINFHLEDNMGEIIRDGLYVTIIGAPNVGKSSLINLLSKKDVAIVSSIAGTTRDVIEVSFEISGISVTIADTAGLRESDDIIELEGIKRTYLNLKKTDYVIALFDATKLPQIDKHSYDLINDNTIIVLNKIDLVEDYKLPDFFKPEIYLSTSNKEGLDDLILKFETIIKNNIFIKNDPIVTRARHRESLSETVFALKNFSFDLDITFAAEELRIAASHLGKITGKIDIEDVLDKIFSSFCIGK